MHNQTHTHLLYIYKLFLRLLFVSLWGCFLKRQVRLIFRGSAGYMTFSCPQSFVVQFLVSWQIQYTLYAILCFNYE